MSRKIKFVEGEFYHIYHRGNYKQPIFLENRDYIRFMFLLVYFQSEIKFKDLNRYVKNYEKSGSYGVEKNVIKNIVDQRTVELIDFTLMPNHLHLGILEKKKGGCSFYMERILKSYTKYFNIKYEKSGHLFQGPFQNKHIRDNRYLLHLSAYIHRNCREISKWKDREEVYPWSSYQDYTKKNRWGNLLSTKTILDQFRTRQDYRSFLRSSPTKNLDNLPSD